MAESAVVTTVIDQGHFIYDRLFGRRDMAHVLEGLASHELKRTKGGARHVLRVPAVQELAADPRLVGIAGRFVGPGATAFRATLFDKSPGANWLVVWHQDTALPLLRRIEHPDWGPWSTKAGVLYAHAPASALGKVVALRVSLDDSTGTNGPLRVLPNTHRGGVLDDGQIERLARETSPVECLAASGGVVAMRPLTVHASSKAIDDRSRRVLHIEYAATFEVGTGLELAIC